MYQFHFDTNSESIRGILVEIGMINAQPVRNKNLALLDYMNETNLDLVVISEMWLNDKDESWKASTCLHMNNLKFITVDITSIAEEEELD